ncbi:MAG TPA: hypothetical protein VJV76_09025 [Gaiellaceae bacterium]|nr:hypothetical protein [Gaiellaceae bacterium]
MRGCLGARVVTVAAVTSVLAAASAWTAPAPAAPNHSTLKYVAGTVSCTTVAGAVQLDAIAYRPAFGYAAAFIETGFPNTPGTITLVGVQTGKSNYTVDKRCDRTRKSVRFTRRGLTSAGVVKAGYDQSPMVYCGAPRRMFVRYRLGFAGSGKPATATIGVWAKRKNSSRLREIGYVQWSPSRSVTYYSRKACTSQY